MADGLHVAGGYRRAGAVETLVFDDGELQLVLVPYLDPMMAPSDEQETDPRTGTEATGMATGTAATGTAASAGRQQEELDPLHPVDEAPRRRRVTHASVLQHRLAAARAQVDGRRSLVVAHAFVAGGTGSDSERELSVGGVDRAPKDALDGFTYAALGHLHRPQSVGRPSLRYSGTPLAYSFSETEAKTVTIVDLPPSGARHHCFGRARRVRACDDHRATGTASPTRRFSQPDAMGAGRLTDRDVVLDHARLRRRFHSSSKLAASASRSGATTVCRPASSPVTPLDLAVEFWESTAAVALRRDRPPARQRSALRASTHEAAALTLRAFGSFPGEETIDFEALAPLGLFVVAGPTGSGKSTIFDALVFASTAVFRAAARRTRCAPTMRPKGSCPRWCSSSKPAVTATGPADLPGTSDRSTAVVASRWCNRRVSNAVEVTGGSRSVPA